LLEEKKGTAPIEIPSKEAGIEKGVNGEKELLDQGMEVGPGLCEGVTVAEVTLKQEEGRTGKTVRGDRDSDKEDGNQGRKGRPMVVPYVGEISKQIGLLNKEYGITTVFRRGMTIASSLSMGRKEKLKTRYCIYQITCQCDGVYVGETYRKLATRLKEHKDDFRLGRAENTWLSKHVLELDHRARYEDIKIVGVKRNMVERKVSEAIVKYKLGEKAINLKDGLSLRKHMGAAVAVLESALLKERERRRYDVRQVPTRNTTERLGKG